MAYRLSGECERRERLLRLSRSLLRDECFFLKEKVSIWMHALVEIWIMDDTLMTSFSCTWTTIISCSQIQNNKKMMQRACRHQSRWSGGGDGPRSPCMTYTSQISSHMRGETAVLYWMKVGMWQRPWRDGHVYNTKCWSLCLIWIHFIPVKFISRLI